MINKKILIGAFFLFGIFSIGFISSYSLSSPQLTSPGISSFNFLGSQGGNAFSLLNKNSCKKGQDFLVQIAPFGCTPSIVRSDLLGEQNVPVFCKLSATQFNPLIKVNAINSISFRGKYPKEVSGIGFYPAKAALGNQRVLLNSPILNNIGYAVIVLKQQPNESKIPDFVTGNLTASIRYNVNNAFGVGKASYYLPELSSEEWNAKFNQYGFWNGKGFLRAEGIEGDSAVISVYLDKTHKFSTFKLKVGQTSNNIYLPGLYCRAGLKLKLDSLDNPDTKAKLNINGNIVQVSEGEKFLQNECRVRNIEKQGINQKVEIGCSTDNGFTKVNLRINPKVNLTINGINDGKPESYGVGDKLYDIQNKDGKIEKSVYLGYIGETADGTKFIIPVVNSELTSKAFKETLIYQQLPNMVKGVQYNTGNFLADLVLSVVKSAGFGAVIGTNFLTTGSYPVGWIYEQGSNKNLGKNSQNSHFGDALRKILTGHKITFLGLANAEDNTEIFVNNKNLKQNYENAMNDYRKIIDDFPNEKENQNSIETFGEKALFNAIDLADKTEQRKKVRELCNEFEGRYPKSNNLPSICRNSLKLSSSENSEFSISLNGKTKDISFEGISEPTLDEYGAEILIRAPDGKIERKVLRKNQLVYFGTTNSFIVKGQGATNLYFRYSDKWEWSLDKINWMGVTTILVNGGLYDGKSLIGANMNLIKSLQGKDFNDGESILNAKGKEETSSQFIQLISLDVNSASIKSSLFSGEGKLTKDKAENFGSNYIFTLTKINLKKVARISVLPNIKYSGTEANFSFRIAIEKRAIQLSPEKISERIDTLNASINKWTGISEKLGTVVKGFNAACLVTGAYLTAKNFFTNLDGKAIARKEIMTSSGGWRDICKDEIAKTHASMDSCLLKHSDEIDKDVGAYLNAMNGVSVTDKNLCSELGKIKSGLGSNVSNGQTGNNEKTLVISPDLSAAFSPDTKTNKCGKVSLTQAKDLLTYQNFLNQNPNSAIRKSFENERYKILSGINANVQDYAEYNKYIKNLKAQNWITGAKNIDFQSSDKNAIVGNYGGATANSGRGDIKKGALVQPIYFDNTRYYVTLRHDGGNIYSIENVYDSEGIKLGDTVRIVSTIKSKYGRGFKKYDSSSYNNPFKEGEAKVSYFETAPYKGLPALVPFDLNHGWYAVIEQILPGFGNIRAYDKSGKVSSFWICNVGEDGRADGINKDNCQQYNPGTGQIYGQFPGLDKSTTRALVSKAMRAINDAARARQNTPDLSGRIRILGQLISVGKPAVSVPNMQCQDFMSPKDCLLLFNVCDPVVCPTSRCDLGGTYPVADVIQSGIVGSTLLCLPNIKEKIAVPVCLSGIKAGIDSLVSVQKNYRDCLQENLDTGRTVGICDEIHSIYLCDFFWNQAAPFSKLIIPKLFEYATGQTGLRGGGEYLNVQSAWKNAQKSVNYITNYYGANSFKAFKVKLTEGIGKAICKNFVSATYPADIGLSSLIEPRSPPQFTAWFSETTYTTATVPVTSEYKVFYHIYAGKNNIQNIGAYYSVYLKNPMGTSFYQTNPIVTIASGYIAKGGYASQTKEFVAPAGYKELCIRVNAQEKCGFKKVSTDFAINYLQDKYLQQQASQTNINSESECVSGTSSAYSLLNPNLQAGVSEAVNPAIYNQGIVRICSSENPGKNTDATRWKQVGTCDNGKGHIKCYIDTQSVKKVITSLSIKNETLRTINEGLLEKLKKEGNYINDFGGLIKEINKKTPEEKINYINDNLIGRAFFNAQKAELLLLRGNAYADIVKMILNNLVKNIKSITSGGNNSSNVGSSNSSSNSSRVSYPVSYNINETAFKNNRNEAEVIAVINFAKNTSYEQRKCSCGNDCGSYAKFLVDASNKNGIPDPLLLLSLMMQESSCNSSANFESSVGLMQIDLSNCGKYGLPERNSGCKELLISNPQKNIEIGAEILKEKYNAYGSGKIFQGCTEKNVKYSGWGAAIRGYNGWGCNSNYPGQDNYVKEVMNRFYKLSNISK